jgi:mannose-6-phosphate isomerase-like protein (cupin superfamily)
MGERVGETVLIGTIDSPVEVMGVHGGENPIYWKRFMTGNMMWSELDSFEHVRVPIGTIIGEHVHSRTEEIYFVVKGRGEMHVGDEVREVGPGDLILTPLHERHSFHPIGSEEVQLIVSEVLPPAITDVLPPHAPAVEG